MTTRGPEAAACSGTRVSLQVCVALALVLGLLAGCVPLAPRPAPPQSQPTVLPPHPPDVSQIPDAVPRYEPRSAFGNPPFYDVDGRRYFVRSSGAGYIERGVASWYGTEFHGLRTATGEPYDMFAMTAAHKTLPLPCYARVTNLSNGRSVVVRINDRGPFVSTRIIDLSYAAAAKLDMIGTGTALVQVETLTPPGPGAMPVSTPAVTAASVGLSSVPALPDNAMLPTSAPAPTLSAPLAPSAPTPPAAVRAPTSSPLYIQVGAFAQPEHAVHVRQQLHAAGFDDVFTLTPDSARHLTRVRIGPIASVQQYDVLLARLARLGFRGAKLAQD